MKFIKYLIPLLIVGFTASNVFAQIRGQETSFERDLRNRDDQPVREFVQSKENIDIKQKAQNLEISGDVRFEWRYITEEGIAPFLRKKLTAADEDEGQLADVGDISEIPSDAPVLSVRKVPRDNLGEVYRSFMGGDHVDLRGIPLSNNDFDVEFNLKIKYNFEDAFAFAHVQFDNPAGSKGRNDCFDGFGILDRDGKNFKVEVDRDDRWAFKGGGEHIGLNLRRAYIGYNIWANGKQRIDIEIGRRKLSDIFVSEIEFTNRFDGILLKYAGEFGEYSDFYWNNGVFVIDDRVNHYGYATEFGFLSIFLDGLDLRYSYIDWTLHRHNRCFIHHPLGADFQNSQISFSYTFKQLICAQEYSIELYGGFLINHAAKPTIFTHNKKSNLGWYAGVTIGEVIKKGDWSLDIEYIFVQALAVSDYDVGSIGRNNIYNELITDLLDETFLCDPNVKIKDFAINPRGAPSSGINGYMPRRGNANFMGARAELLYAITDNFTLDFVGEFSVEADKKIGGPHRYSSFEIEAIYAF